MIPHSGYSGTVPATVIPVLLQVEQKFMCLTPLSTIRRTGWEGKHKSEKSGDLPGVFIKGFRELKLELKDK